MKHEFVDSIDWYGVDSGCDVIVASNVQWSNVEHNGIAWSSGVIIK